MRRSSVTLLSLRWAGCPQNHLIQGSDVEPNRIILESSDEKPLIYANQEIQKALDQKVIQLISEQNSLNESQGLPALAPISEN